MREHVYNNFWSWHYVRILHINFDTSIQKFVKVRKWQYVLTFVSFLITSILFFWAVYDNITKFEFVFAELWFVINSPFLFMSNVYYLKCNFYDSRQIVSMIESLQTFDQILKSQRFSKTSNGWIRSILYLINMTFFVYIPTTIFFICCFIYNRNTKKMYVFQLLYIIVPMGFALLFFLFTYLLVDRTNKLNQKIVEFANSNMQTVCCHVCKMMRSKKLCKYHQLK